MSAFNTRKSTDRNLFVRTHVAAYFLSVLVCDLLQGMFVDTSCFYTSATSVGLAVGSIMNQKWVQDMEVLVGHFCTIQGDLRSNFHCEVFAELGAGAVKQTSDVGSALFTLVSARSSFQSRMCPLIRI